MGLASYQYAKNQELTYGLDLQGGSHILLQVDANLRGLLKAEGLLSRDPRMKERKKSGQPGARKRFQFSKR